MLEWYKLDLIVLGFMIMDMILGVLSGFYRNLVRQRTVVLVQNNLGKVLQRNQ